MKLAASDEFHESTAPHTSRLFAWPGWRHIGFAATLGAAFTLWFVVVYGTADYFTGLRTERVRVDFDFEQSIPFVPATVIFYMAIYPLFWCAPFVLRTRSELLSLALALGAATLAAGVVFLAIPAELAFSTLQAEGSWRPLFTIADRLNLRYNLFPSLHVALSTTCADVYARKGGIPARLLFGTWAVLIAVSTVLTHQHHLIDVAGGAVLGLAASRLLYPRLLRPLTPMA